MYTGGNMDPVPLNATEYPVTTTTPASGFGTVLMLLQILFGTKKFDQQPEQDLEMIPNITWSQGNFTTDGQPNPKESKTTHEEDNDVSKIIKKREIGEFLTDDEDFLRKRHAGIPFKGKSNCDSIDGLHPLPVPPPSGDWQFVTLYDHFGPGSKIVIRGKSREFVPRMTFNLEYSNTIPLHIDNRWHFGEHINQMVFNTYEEAWAQEVIYNPAEIHEGANFVVSIECLKNEFKICINDAFFTTYTHRVSPEMINQLSIMNAATITSVYYRGSP